MENGRKREKAVRVHTRREAERAAIDFEQQLNDKKLAGMEWSELLLRYDREHLATMSDGYRRSTFSAVASLEKIRPLGHVDDITPDLLSRWTAELRKQEKSSSSILSYIKHVMAVLNWAEAIGLIEKAPRYRLRDIGSRSEMRSRPITRDEFEQMKAEARQQKLDHKIWTDYLDGLWLSGMRLRESLLLSWDWTEPFSVDLTGSHPCFRILSSDKKRRDYLAPMAPDFAAWLNERPDQTGRVFDLPFAADWVGRQVAKFGRGIQTSPKKTATAHDIRRAFGTRWAAVLMPAELKQLMRHASIATTMKHYIRIEVDQIGEKLKQLADRT